MEYNAYDYYVNVLRDVFDELEQEYTSNPTIDLENAIRIAAENCADYGAFNFDYRIKVVK